MIYTDNRQEKIEISEEFINMIESVCTYTLKKESMNHKYQISLVFVDNEEIKNINRDTRNIDKITDVLSFPMLEYQKDKYFKDIYINHTFECMFLDGEDLILGDMVLSLERAKEQAIEYNHSYEREVCYLIVHSILHLLGYDHMEDHEKKVMRSREEEILNELDIKR